MDIKIFNSTSEMGQHAAAWCAGFIQKTISELGAARVILATGASQLDFLSALVSIPDVPWDKVTCFHLDEYVDLDEGHPASFRKYLNDRVWQRVSPKMAAEHPLDPNDIESYVDLLNAAPIDLACVGIGENGHIAFNDPHVADFKDPQVVKVVTLDDACRRQQVGEGWFSSLEETPTQAATLTIPTIMRSKVISVVAPETRKAQAVVNTLKGQVSMSCPASVLQTHRQVVMWLDKDSAVLYQQSLKTTLQQQMQEVPFPGLVDVQVNGYNGVDFSSKDLTEESFKHACYKLLAESALIVFLPTLITSDIETYAHNLPIIAHVLNSDPELSEHIPGIHLEGPFLNPAPGACGCHDPKKMLAPDLRIFQHIINLSGGYVKMITIAADEPGASVLVAYAAAQGIIVSIGHHLANVEEISKMATAGAKMLTHLGNGLPEMIHRHRNPIWAGLSESKLMVGMIGDGHHLPDEVMKVFIQARKSKDIILISDCSPLTGLPPGEYTIHGGVQVVLERSRKLKQKNGPGLAGSAKTLLQSANYLLQSGIIKNFDDLAQVAYRNPLRMLGLDPDALAAHFGNQLHWKNGELTIGTKMQNT